MYPVAYGDHAPHPYEAHCEHRGNYRSSHGDVWQSVWLGAQVGYHWRAPKQRCLRGSHRPSWQCGCGSSMACYGKLYVLGKYISQQYSGFCQFLLDAMFRPGLSVRHLRKLAGRYREARRCGHAASLRGEHDLDNTQLGSLSMDACVHWDVELWSA